MKICTKCKKELADDFKLCPYCGEIAPKNPVPQDQANAIKGFQEIVDEASGKLDTPEQHFQNGYCFWFGEGETLNGQPIKQDYYRAFSELSKAAGMGHAEATGYLGVCYSEGKGVETDTEKAIYYWTKAIAMGDHASAYHYGLNCKYGKNNIPMNEKKAFKLLSEAAHAELKAKDSIATTVWMEFADCFHHGVGTDINNQEAIRWYTLVTENDDDCPNSHRALIELYNTISSSSLVFSTMYRKEKLRSYTYLATKENDTEAQSQLGYYNETGYCNPKNVAEAIKWYEKASNGGNAKASSLLADLYRKGTDVKKDETKAFELYNLSLKQGFNGASYNVMMAYIYGRGVKQNLDMATKLAEEKLAKGDGSGAYEMGQYYEKKHKKKLAADWYMSGYMVGHALSKTAYNKLML